MKFSTLKFGLVVLSVLLVTFAGCAGKATKVSRSQIVTQPAPGKALVYFLLPTNESNIRENSWRVATDAPLYDNDVYVGSLAAGSHIAVQSEPGKHLFMVLGERPDFARGELLAGKTYYILVARWPNGSRFDLVAQNGQTAHSEVHNWVTSTNQVVPNEKGTAWAVKNAEKTLKLKAKYLPDWENRMARDVREAEKHTLRPESGK